MNKEAMIALAREAAGRHHLDPVLVCAVIEQESSWDTHSARHEPAFQAKNDLLLTDGEVRGQAANGFEDLHTERVFLATSWGLMQVLGQTAREFGCTFRNLPTLCEPHYGVEFGCRKLADCFRRAGGDMRAALLRYNGGGDLRYPARVLKRQAPYA